VVLCADWSSYHARSYACRVREENGMGRGSRARLLARPRRQRLYEVDINEPVDLTDEDWWWLEGLPALGAAPPDDIPVEDEAPSEDAPAGADDPPETAIQVNNFRVLFLLNRLIFNPILNCFTYDGPYEPCKSNRKNTRGLKLNFNQRAFVKNLPGDPNTPYGGLGPPIPPSTHVKNLSTV
jgi:hypothetical protein